MESLSEEYIPLSYLVNYAKRLPDFRDAIYVERIIMDYCLSQGKVNTFMQLSDEIRNHFMPGAMVSSHTSVDKQIDDEILAKAIRAVLGYYWASAAHAVIFCVCRDKYNFPNNMSQFETKLMSINSLKGIAHPCKDGTIASALHNNPYMRLNIDKWEVNGAMQRVLTLRDNFIEEVERARYL